MTGLALRNLLRRPTATSRSRCKIYRHRVPRRVLLETLEDRRLLATIIINTLGDDPTIGGPVSIREAINQANPTAEADVIEFDSSLNGETILLTRGQLEISHPLTINGPGQGLLTIDAQQNSRLLNIEGASIDVDLSGLTITGGKTTEDNQLFIGPNLETTYSGGGIRFLSDGTLTLIDSTVSGNSTTGKVAAGGGIFSSDGSVMLTDSAVSNNSTMGEGGYGGGMYSI